MYNTTNQTQQTETLCFNGITIKKYSPFKIVYKIWGTSSHSYKVILYTEQCWWKIKDYNLTLLKLKKKIVVKMSLIGVISSEHVNIVKMFIGNKNKYILFI